MSFPGSILLTDEMLRAETTTKRHPLGTRGYTLDGRAFRYALNGAANLESGDLVTGMVPPGAWGNSTELTMETDTGITTTWGYVSLSSTAVAGGSATADAFADGYLWCQSTEGKGGQMVRILSNTTSDSGTAGQGSKFTFHPDSRFVESFDTETRLAVVPNPYYKVITIPGAAAPTSLTLGVASFNVTAAYYFWLQTWGPCPVDTELAAVDIGRKAVRSTSTGVTYTTATGDWGGIIDANIVGTFMSAAQDSANEFMLVYLTLAP